MRNVSFSQQEHRNKKKFVIKSWSFVSHHSCVLGPLICNGWEPINSKECILNQCDNSPVVVSTTFQKPLLAASSRSLFWTVFLLVFVFYFVQTKLKKLKRFKWSTQFWRSGNSSRSRPPRSCARFTSRSRCCSLCWATCKRWGRQKYQDKKYV